jgi:UDP-2,4-diacetamido-2,4,6-trideoxy-beta-L-altropyranose hydrolase
MPRSRVSQKILLIRADANVATGTGHAMRCLALAQAWQDAGGLAVFAMVDPPSSVRERIGKESIEVLALNTQAGAKDDSTQTIALARERDAAWVVVDGYQFGRAFQQDLRAAGLKTLFLDDYGHSEHYYADLVLNQNVSAAASAYKSREPHSRLLLGPQYCLLRREFCSWREWKREIGPVAQRVLVTMGGSDPDNFTGRAIEALDSIEDDRLEAVIVVGGSNERSATLERMVASVRSKKITFRQDVSNMAELMAWADVAVSAAGTTCWEICRLGLPALLIDLADNQTPVARELQRRGCAIYLGGPKEVSAAKLAEQVERLRHSQEDRQLMSSRSRELVDGEGARRVVSILLGVGFRLRPATENDIRLLWEWANDSEVRAASFSSAPIAWETHAAWFTEKLHQDGCRILIAEDGTGAPVGQLRFDARADGDTEIDVSIAKTWRGLGLAAKLIREGAQLIWKPGSRGRIHAFVKQGNVASARAFERGGFRRIGMEQIQGNAAIHFIYEGN